MSDQGPLRDRYKRVADEVKDHAEDLGQQEQELIEILFGEKEIEGSTLLLSNEDDGNPIINFVISDLHLMTRDLSKDELIDRFILQVQAFKQENPDVLLRIIFNGDILDPIVAEGSLHDKDAYTKVLGAYHRLFSELDRLCHEVVLLNGNHDPIISHVDHWSSDNQIQHIRTMSACFLKSGEQFILVEHGHRPDEDFAHFIKTELPGVIGFNPLEHPFLIKCGITIGRFFEWIPQFKQIFGNTNKGLIEFITIMERKLRKKEISIVINGHTHEEDFTGTQVVDITFYNSGARTTGIPGLRRGILPLIVVDPRKGNQSISGGKIPISAHEAPLAWFKNLFQRGEQ